MFPWGFLGEDSRFYFRFVPRFDSPNGITFPLETVLPGTRKECSNHEILTKWQATPAMLRRRSRTVSVRLFAKTVQGNMRWRLLKLG